MGAAGTDVALETADVALMADDLSHLPFAIRIARTILGVMRQNIAFSIIVKAVFLLICLDRLGHTLDGRCRRRGRIVSSH